MLDIFLLVTSIITSLIMIVMTVYVLIIYTHPEDLKCSKSIPSKIIILISSCVVWMFLFLLPLDIAASKKMDVGLNLSLLYQILFLVSVILIFLLLPIAIFLYNSDEEKPLFRRIMGSIFSEFVILVLLGTVSIICWKTLKTVDFSNLEVVLMESAVFSEIPISQSSNFEQITLFKKVVYDTPCFIFIIILLIFLSWVFFVVFAGIGISAVPLDSILEWKNRPKPKTAKQIAEQKIRMRLKTEELLNLIEEIDEKMKTSEMKKVGFFKNWKNERKMNGQHTNLINELAKMKEEFDLFKLEMELKVSPLISLLWLIFGIISGLFSIILLTQILVGQLIVIKNVPLASFLTLFFEFLDRKMSGFVTIIIFILFGFFLLIFTLKGVLVFGFRFFCLVSIYPIKLGKTFANAFMFNLALVLVCVPAILHFQIILLGPFLTNSSGRYLFSGIIEKIIIFKWLFEVKAFFYAFLVWTFLGLVYVCCKNRPAKQNLKSVLRDKKLEE